MAWNDSNSSFWFDTGIFKWFDFVDEVKEEFTMDKKASLTVQMNKNET